MKTKMKVTITLEIEVDTDEFSNDDLVNYFTETYNIENDDPIIQINSTKIEVE